MPPDDPTSNPVWPYWPIAAAHLLVARGRRRRATGRSRTKAFVGESGKVKALKTVQAGVEGRQAGGGAGLGAR